MTSNIPDTYVVKRREQREALSSPIRLEIIGQFTSPGGMSIAEIADRMGRPAASLYYHFRILEKTGLLRRVGTRPRGKRSEALFEPVASRIAVQARSSSPRDLRAIQRTMASAFRMAERDLEAALVSGKAVTEGAHRDLYATRLHCRITPATLAEVNRHLRAIERVLCREARRKKLPPDANRYCSLTMALLPLRGRDRE